MRALQEHRQRLCLSWPRICSPLLGLPGGFQEDAQEEDNGGLDPSPAGCGCWSSRTGLYAVSKTTRINVGQFLGGSQLMVKLNSYIPSLAYMANLSLSTPPPDII